MIKAIRVLNFSLIGLAGGGVIFYSFWVLLRLYDPFLEDIVSSVLLIALGLFVVILGGVITANKTTSPAMRRAWLLISLAELADTVAELIWLYTSKVLHVEPFPSLADLFYLLFYPLMLAGVLSLPHLPLERDRRLLYILDTVILVMVGALFLWYFILAPMQVQGAGNLADIILIAYPIGDIFLLASLVSLIQRDMEEVDRLVLIALSFSMIATCLADILFAVYETYGMSYEMPPLNICWMTSTLAVLIAAGWQILNPMVRKSKVIETFRPLLRRALLYLGPILGMGLILYNFIKGSSADARLPGILVVCALIVGLVLARQYTLLQDNIRLYKDMEKLAVTDALTGLYNRHFFNTAIVQEIKRAERYRRPLSVLMMDVDNFKAYNDTYGHLEGDKTLRAVAELLRSRMRSADLLARFGGDEFVAILPETNFEQAEAAGRKIEQTITEHFKQFNLGMSIGIAVSKAGISSTNLLAEADRQLYRVKPKRKTNNGA